MAPVIGGSLVTDVANLSFDSSESIVQHKRDVDAFEDGCIHTLELAFQSGSGCRLVVLAADVLTFQNRLRVAQVDFYADSQCPSFPDRDEGHYVGTAADLVNSWVELTPPVIPESNVAMACFEATFLATLRGTIATSDDKTLTLDGTSLVLSGSFSSTAMERSCPDACAEDGHCPSGQICTAGRCLQGCTQHQDCATGEVCRDARCSPGCRDDDECAGGEVCDEFACIAGCREDEGCAAGEICEGQSCVAGCRADDQCELESVCEGNACVSGCRDDDGCAAPRVCEGSQCTEPCASSAACENGMFCSSGHCLAGCGSDEDCTSGSICEADVCVSGCRGDGDCGAGQVCEADQCVDVQTEPIELPCDIYADANTPCVAAYSMVRVLSSAYNGPLYEVRAGAPNGYMNTGSGGVTQDIGTLSSGFADIATLEAFCSTEICTVSIIYDQSGRGNDLRVAPAGCLPGTAGEADWESDAMASSVTVGGHAVRPLYMEPHQGYRNNQTSGMPTGSQPQGIYMVADGRRYGTACCWNFGNGSTDNCYGVNGETNALFFGLGFWGTGTGTGPWFMADFGDGVWAGGSGYSTSTNANNPAMNVDYAFGILKTHSSNYALRMGNAQSGNLTTAYDGALPAPWAMHGGIILGIGSENSNSSFGTFFEGAITAGRPTDETDEAVFRSVQAVGYGQ